MNNVAMNIRLQGFLWTYDLNSLGCLPQSGNAASYGKSMFNVLKNS